MRRLGAITLAALLAIGCASPRRAGLAVSPSTPVGLAAVLEAMPAPSVARDDQLAARLLEVPDAVPQMVEMLGSRTADDDAAARYGLESLTRWATRPGGTADRVRLARALEATLATSGDVGAQRFVLAQLERLGEEASAGPIAAWIDDERLGDDATRALVGIGGDAAAASIVAALEAAPTPRKDLLIAAGRLRATAALPILVAALAHDSPEIRAAAAGAVARLDEPGAGEALADAVAASTGVDRRELAASALAYGASIGGDEGGALIERIWRGARDADDEAIQLAAATAMTDANPAAAGRLLDEASADASPRLAAHLENLRLRLATNRERADRARAESDEGFASLFNGEDLSGWVGATDGYFAHSGAIVCDPSVGGNLYTAETYGDFVLRFEFKLTPGANNGLGIRAPLEGDAAYVGIELQVLDNRALVFRELQPFQYHGSVYGIAAAERGHLRPVGEWNEQEVVADGRRIRVVLNGATIVDVDLDEATAQGTADGRDHPGLARARGHIGFLGHGSRVEYRNIRLRELP